MNENPAGGETEQTSENPQPEADAGIETENVNLSFEGAEEDILPVENVIVEIDNGGPENLDIQIYGESANDVLPCEVQDTENDESESAESEMLSVSELLQGVISVPENPSEYSSSTNASIDKPSLTLGNSSTVQGKVSGDQEPECDQLFTTALVDCNHVSDTLCSGSNGATLQILDLNVNQFQSNSNGVQSEQSVSCCETEHVEHVFSRIVPHDTNLTEIAKASEPDAANQVDPVSVINLNQLDQTCAINGAESLKPLNSENYTHDDNTAQSTHITPIVENKPRKFPISRKSPPGMDFLHLSDSSEDELLNELDAALLNRSLRSPKKPNTKSIPHKLNEEKTSSSTPKMTSQSVSNGLKQFPINSAIVQNVELKLEALNKQLLAKEEELKAAKMSCETLLVNHRHVEDVENLYLPQIKEMEKTITVQEKEILYTKETLASHDTLAKRKISTMQNDYKLRIDQVTKMYEDCLRDKDAMVVNYAVAEQKNIEAKKTTEKAEVKLKECLKDQEALKFKLKAAKVEKNKMAAEVDSKLNELSAAHKEMEHMKEMFTSADVRIKWAQNKLKSELEGHKETKIELEKTSQKLKMAKEETSQIRKDCQAIVKQYQESEEIKSNSLDKELKLKESELIVQRQEKSDSQEIFNMTVKELDILKGNHKDVIAELKTFHDKVYCLDNERKDNEETMCKYKEIIQKQKGENKTILDKVGNMGQLADDFNRAQDMIKNLDLEISELRITNKDLQSDIEGCRTRESELLGLTQKLSRTNAKLQSENTNANNQVVGLSSKCSNMEMDIQNFEMRCKNLWEKLTEDGSKNESECTRLNSELSDKIKLVSDLKQKLEDEKDLNKTLKRKHANNIKDMTRQLHQAKKKIDSYENPGEKDGTSLGSRTSSNGSLNTINDNHSQQSVPTHHHHHHHHHQTPVQPVKLPEVEYPVITEQVEVDKQVLIERIVRLQKAHARKNEKLEFLQDHIQQLVDEIQRKKKIIQSYILREEQGALAPEAMDENKSNIRSEVQALLAKKGGIMASLYNHHSQDGSMTLDLSLEINQKLQGVLEDTLLKNITLKDNIDTLGQEIAKLSKENRQLQIHLQGH